MTAFRFSPAIGLSMLGAVFAGNANALDMNNIQGANGTTANHELGGAASCNMTVKEYFSKENIVSINNQLAKLHDWIRLNDFFNEENVIDYLDPEEDELGINQHVYEAFDNIKRITAFYDPDSKEAVAYLRSDAAVTLGTIFAYTGYTEILKTMLMVIGADDQLNELKKLDKTVEDLNQIAGKTEALLVAHMTKECPFALSQN